MHAGDPQKEALARSMSKLMLISIIFVAKSSTVLNAMTYAEDMVNGLTYCQETLIIVTNTLKELNTTHTPRQSCGSVQVLSKQG